MPTITKTIDNFSLTSLWKGYQDAAGTGWYSTPTFSSVNKTIDLSEIPDNSTINSVTFSYTITGAGTKRVFINGGVYIFTGTSSYDATAWFSSMKTFGATDVRFNFNATGGTGTRSAAGIEHYAVAYFQNITFTFDYTPPFSKCKEPSSVSLSSTIVAAGGSATLSWSGAAAGTSNAITGYAIYQISGGTTTLLKTVASTATSGSTSVNAPPTAGSSYSFRVVTVGTASGYNSGQSASVTLTANVVPSTPANISLTPTRLESGPFTLSWKAVTDSNLVGYNVERKINSGSWTRVKTNYTSTSMTDSPTLSRGDTVQYRVQAVDTVTTSAWGNSGTAMKNKLPAAVSAMYPANNAVIHSRNPYIVATFAADPDNEVVTVMAQVDSGTAVQIGSVKAAGGTIYYKWASNISAGSHTIKVWTLDNLGATGTATSRTVTISNITYSRSIESGTLISSSSISHKAEIQQLYNILRDWQGAYGITKTTVPTVGEYSKWGTQMKELQTKFAALFTVVNATAPTWETTKTGMYPKAAVIKQLRNLYFTKGW